MTDNELKIASKQLVNQMLKKANEVQTQFDVSKTDAMLSVVVDQLSALLVLEQERQHREKNERAMAEMCKVAPTARSKPSDVRTEIAHGDEFDAFDGKPLAAAVDEIVSTPEQLRAALEPFARGGQIYMQTPLDKVRDDSSFVQPFTDAKGPITVGMLRAAYRAWSRCT